MSTIQQLREGLHDAWDSVVDGWQRLYRRAAGAITRFTPGRHEEEADRRELSVRSSGWGVLAAEVFDDAEKIVVRLEVPGMDRDDFDLRVVDGYLVVRGEKRVEREGTEGDFRVTECAYGRFERAIPLPEEIEADQARARYRRGVLRVELPKRARARRRKVSVTIE